MKIIGDVLTAIAALFHLGFLALEMFLWNTPTGQRIFNMTPEVSAASAVLAMNQGLYNGLLAAGLIYGLVTGKRDFKLFFLGLVIVAGVFGGITAKPTIFFVQALPAVLAFVFVWMGAKKVSKQI